MIHRADHQAAVYVNYASGLTGSAGGVQDEQSIFGVHVLGGTFGRKLNQLAKVYLARAGASKSLGSRVKTMTFSTPLQARRALRRQFPSAELVSTAEPRVAHDHDPSPRVFHAIA